MNPKVSILVPVYNTAPFIEKCARSLFEQTFEPIEYLFLDDCSPDNAIEMLQIIIDQYPERAHQTTIIRNDRNRGLAAARNTLIDHATGKYVLHVDSDDYIEQDCVETLLKKAEEENADIVVSDIFREKKHATTIQKIRFSPDKTEYINLVLSSLSPSYNCGKLIKTHLYHEYHIRWEEGLNVLEDYHTLPRLAYFANKIVKVEKPLYHYIQYNENAYTKHCNEQFLTNVFAAIKIVESFFLSQEDAIRYEKAISAFKLMTKINNLKNADRKLQQKILNLYPEIQLNGIQDMVKFSFIDKLLYQLMQKKRLTLIFIITFGLNSAKKIKSTTYQLLKRNA